MRAITTEDGKSLPNYVFLRGGAVAVLLLINKKMLLVRQYRVPLQRYILESPAGMLDEEGDFSGVAAKEIEEETGFKI
jgi:8-oxo-dGTP pyrophosphatase MutT (NUDIX family)